MQNRVLEKIGIEWSFKTPKRLQFQQYHGIQNHKVCCTQTLRDTLKPKYFINHGIYLKLQKILRIQTGPSSFSIA